MSQNRTIGKVYNIPPQPPVEANTRYLEAGAITIGVEYRDVNPDNLVETYKDNPDHLTEMLEESPEGGFADEGVSIHVYGTEDGHEYLRFDVFDDEPHYHYVHRSEDIVNNVIEFDAAANGDMLAWALDRLRHHLPSMLPRAQGEHLVAKLDQATINRTVDEVERLATEARAKGRQARGAAQR